MKYFLAVFLLLVFQVNSQGQTKIKIDSSVTVVLPYRYDKDQTMLKALQQMNETIIYATILYTAKNEKILFTASKYINDEAISIDSAFNKTVYHVPDGMEESYELVDHGKYRKEERLLRFKQSKITFGNGQEVFNIMYYFMRKDKSEEMYEIKITGAAEDSIRDKKILEQIALSLKFL